MIIFTLLLALEIHKRGIVNLKKRQRERERFLSFFLVLLLLILLPILIDIIALIIIAIISFNNTKINKKSIG